MKIMKVSLLLLIILGLTFSVAFAKNTCRKKGERHSLTDTKFAGGSKACSECHPNGKGLEKAADKKEFKIMGKTQKNIEEAVNFCIINANMGKAIDVKSEQMKDMVAYIKSLKGKAAPKAPGYPGKKAPGYK